MFKIRKTTKVEFIAMSFNMTHVNLPPVETGVGAVPRPTSVPPISMAYASFGLSRCFKTLDAMNAEGDENDNDTGSMLSHQWNNKKRRVTKDVYDGRVIEKTNTVIDKNNDYRVMILVLDKELQNSARVTYNPALKIHEGCSVWDFFASSQPVPF